MQDGVKDITQILAAAVQACHDGVYKHLTL